MRVHNKWFKSSESGNNGGCVEVLFTPSFSQILVRDTKDPSSQPLNFTSDEWRAFIKGAKDGEFDI